MLNMMKLSTKLIGGFVVVAVVTLIVGFFGWKGISNVYEDLTEINDVRLPSIATQDGNPASGAHDDDP
jgi:methyl-accepting chemotaxis protein